METDAPTGLLKKKEVLKLLGIGEWKLRNLVADGQLPVVRIGTCVRYDPADLMIFIADHKARRASRR